MNALAPYMAALHQQDLLEEAEVRRQVRLARAGQVAVPAWRRGLGSGARGLSGLFASAARSLDPVSEIELAEAERAARSGDRGVRRALAG